MTYVIITPVRDEEAGIGQTLGAVAGQTVLPRQWIIVNDGSRDRTEKLIDQFARGHPWVHTLHLPDRGFRQAGGGVIEAFAHGLAVLSEKNWDFLVKLDGDLTFAADYFARCLERFQRDARLGIGGGKIFSWDHGRLLEDSPGDPPFHVRGATKIYRRACWEQIAPLVKAPGWDTIDEVKANMYGWKTTTFPDIPLSQLKPTGGADGSWRNWFKNGRANYITGYHPVFMLLKCLKRSVQKPRFIASAALLAGFCSGYLKGLPQVQEVEVIRYLRKEQFRHLCFQPSIYRRV